MKVLIAFDNSQASKNALQFALKMQPIVDEYFIAYVTPTVIGAGPTFDAYVPASVYQRQEQTADNVLRSAREIMEKKGVNATFLKLDASGDQVARVIVNTAKENAVDLIITGTRKLAGLSRVLLGSVSTEIIKLSEVPTIVAPPLEVTGEESE